MLDIFYEKNQSPIESDLSLVTWKLNDRGVNSEDAIKEIESLYQGVKPQSKIIEQRIHGLDYHALVEVTETPSNKSVSFDLY